MIELTCPHCGRHHQLDDDSAGTRVTCHACGKKFKVPGVVKRSDSPLDRTSRPDARSHNAGSQSSPIQSSSASDSVPTSSSERGAHKAPPSPESVADVDALQPKPRSTDHETPRETNTALNFDPQKASPPTPNDDSVVSRPATLDENFLVPESPLQSPEPPFSESYEVALDLDADEWNQFETTSEKVEQVEGQPKPSLSSPPLGVDDPHGQDEATTQRWRGDGDFKSQDSKSLSKDSSGDRPGHAWTGDALPIDFEGEARPAQTGGDEIRVKCSICDSVTWVKPSKAGKRIVCTDCGSEVRVPEDTIQLPPPRSDVPSSPPQEKKSGWQLSQPVDRPRRDLPESLLGDSKSTPASLHISKIKRWGEPEEETQQKKDEAAVSQALGSTRSPVVDGPKVSEDPVGGHERPEWNEPKDFGIVEWLRDTVVIFRNVTMYGASIAVAFVCGAFGTIAKFALLYAGAENEPIMRIVAMCGMLFSMPCLFLAATTLGAVLMTMVQDGASNAKEIGNWPELNPGELFTHCAPMYVTGFIGVAPGLILAEFVHLVGGGLWGFLVFPLVSGFVMIPPMVLSTFREQSMFSVYSGPVYTSIGNFSKEWINFFILCLGALFVAGVCMIGVGMTPFVLDIPFWLVLGFLWVIYGRWIGILARRLAWFIPVDSREN